MTSFLYYVPGHQADMISHEQIVKAGIGYVFDKPGDVTCNALRSSGPDGKAGAIITNPLRIEPGRSAYKPDQQMWLHNEAGGYWVGLWNDARPSRENLERRKMLAGAKLELADEQNWLIPIARRWSEADDPDRWLDGSCMLPTRLGFGARDVYLRKPLERYALLWAICEADYRHSTGDGTEADAALVGGVNSVFAALAILQANYAVNTAEVELLGLFSQDTPREILHIFGDWENWNAIIEKKKAVRRESQHSSSGPEEIPPSIDQP